MESVLKEVRARYTEMRRLKVNKDEKKVEEESPKKAVSFEEEGKKTDGKAEVDLEQGSKENMRMVTVDFLKRVVDGLRTHQSIQLIKEAIEEYYESAKEGVSEEE